MKICTKCKAEKTTKEFPADRRLRSGLSSQCRMCHAARFARHYAANKEKLIERSRQWQLDNPERFKELLRRHHAETYQKISDTEWGDRKAATKERSRAGARKALSVRWHNDPSFRETRRVYMNNRRATERRARDEKMLQSDIQRIRTIGVKLRRSHHQICPIVRLNPTLLAEAEIAARMIRQRRRDPAKIRNGVRNWKRQNPAAVSAQRFRRRVNLQNAPAVDLTESQWLAIKAAYRFRCAYCGLKKPLTQDHIVPVSKGGAHTASNIIPACQSCNSSKGARLPLVEYQPHLIA